MRKRVTRNFKMADKNAGNKKNYRWEDEEIDGLIVLYEERTCLWYIELSKEGRKIRSFVRNCEELGIETVATKSK